MNAETAYLFRHALLREAAYQLQLPSARARLHGLAFEVLQPLFEHSPDGASRDAWALELAEHAKAAQMDGDDTLAIYELQYLEMAAAGTRKRQDFGRAAECCARIAAHRLCAPKRLVETLIAHAEMLSETAQYAKSRSLAMLARARARDFASPGLEAHACIALAAGSVRVGRLHEALEILNAAEILASEADDEVRLCSSLVTRSDLLRQLGQMDEALAACERAEAIARRRDDKVALGAALANHAGIYAVRGQCDLAEPLIGESIKLARILGNHRALGSRLGNFARVVIELGRDMEAEQAAREALGIAREFADRRSECFVLGSLAAISKRRGQYDATEALLVQAASIACELGEPMSEALCLESLATHYHQRGQTHACREAATRAARLAQFARDARRQARMVFLMARLSQAEGEREAALALRREGERLLRDVGDLKLLAILQKSLDETGAMPDRG